MTGHMGRNEACWCGSGKKYKHCHSCIEDRIRSYALQGIEVPPRGLLKTAVQIAGIRESGKINTDILDFLGQKIEAGITTEEIDRWVYRRTTMQGAYPAPLRYKGFPKSVCTSVNEQVCHGIPSGDIILKDGDIINVDCSTVFRGYFSDSSRMYCIGDTRPADSLLVQTAKECMEIGLRQVRPWILLGDIGHAVHKYAHKKGYSVVRDIGGHGTGLEFHEDPWVSFVSEKNTGMLLVPGMVFTIEPMLNLGTSEVYTDRRNGWTVYTSDGKKSAQWEVSVLVTDTGYEVLAQ